MAGIYKLQKEIKIKVFILQEDQFHSWLWAQRVPTLHWRLRGPITGHGSPAGARPGDGPRAHVTAQRDPSCMELLDDDCSHQKKLKTPPSPAKPVKTENHFNATKFKLSMQASLLPFPLQR